VTMPAPDRYRRLKAVLHAQTEAFDSAEDDRTRLEAGVCALRAVITYLHGDVEVLEKFLTRPLAIVENAIADRAKGAMPIVLDQMPENPGRKPSLTWRENVQACMAFAVKLLIAAGMKAGPAGKRVAALARQYSVHCDDGTLIDARRIRSWRLEIQNRRAPEGARQTYDGLQNLHASLLSSDDDERRRWECEARAVGCVKALA